MAHKLTGWLGNRADSPITLEVTDELAEAFLESSYYVEWGMVSRQLPLWLASADGRNIAWDPRDGDNSVALDDLWERVRKLERGRAQV